MRIHRSARKHGVTDADMLHAIDHSLTAIDLDDQRTLYLGPDQSANLLEVVVLASKAEDEPIVIHAMAMRPQFRRWLPTPDHDEDPNDQMTDKLSDSELDQLAVRTELDLDHLAEQLDQGKVPAVAVRRGRGRPTLGTAPSEPMRLRLEPELRKAVAERARAEGINDSEIVRRALRQYLASA